VCRDRDFLNRHERARVASDVLHLWSGYRDLIRLGGTCLHAHDRESREGE
jgi:hypothetical protein